MNSSNLLLKLLGKVIAKSDDLQTSSFAKTGHSIDQKTGEELVTVEYRYRRKGASPVSPSEQQMNPKRRRMFDELLRAKLAKVGK